MMDLTPTTNFYKYSEPSQLKHRFILIQGILLTVIMADVQI